MQVLNNKYFKIFFICFSCLFSFYYYNIDIFSSYEKANLQIFNCKNSTDINHLIKQRIYSQDNNINSYSPFLLNNSLLNITIQSDWNNINYIKNEYLKNKQLTLKQCKNGTTKLFTLSNPLINNEYTPNTGDNLSYKIQDIDIYKFFNTNRIDNQFYYYSGRIDELPYSLYQQVNFLKVFYLNDFDLYDDISKYNKEKYNSQSTIWMGNKGVIANLHFDRSHNIFIQVYGRKKWTLFPPTNWYSLYLFPSLHPSYHQSQVGNIDNVNQTLFNLFQKHSQPLEVILNPGDIMYIPPYWFHQVETLDDFGISLSTVSPSNYESIIGRVIWDVKHFWENTKSGVDKASKNKLFMISKTLIPDLIIHIYSIINDSYISLNMGIPNILKLLIQTRYILINSQLNININSCSDLMLKLKYTSYNNINMNYDILLKELFEIEKQIILLPEGIREIALGNIIEEFINHIIPLKYTSIYLSHCVINN